MELAPTLTGHTVQNRVTAAGVNPHHWYPVAWSSQLRRGRVLPVQVWGRAIALFRDDPGQAHGPEDACPHRNENTYRYPHSANHRLKGVSQPDLVRLPVSVTETHSFTLLFLRIRLPQILIKMIRPLLSRTIWRFRFKPFLDLKQSHGADFHPALPYPSPDATPSVAIPSR